MNPAPRACAAAGSVTGLELTLATGLPSLPLRELLRAAWYAEDAGRPWQEFAVSVAQLHAQGIGDCDLQWLSCKGFVREVPQSQPAFVLTSRGVALCRQVLALDDPGANGVRIAVPPRPSIGVPDWDGRQRILRLGDAVIKQFQVPAENQELVLTAFQEEAWPARIDDPLPPVPEIEPKRRLHSTIQCLNRNQQTHLLQFHGDGTGRGIRWELLASWTARSESA